MEGDLARALAESLKMDNERKAEMEQKEKELREQAEAEAIAAEDAALLQVLEESKKAYDSEVKRDGGDAEEGAGEKVEKPEKQKLIKLEVFIGEDEALDEISKSRIVFSILKQRLGK